jgi:hypothetical protein
MLQAAHDAFPAGQASPELTAALQMALLMVICAVMLKLAQSSTGLRGRVAAAREPASSQVDTCTSDRGVTVAPVSQGLTAQHIVVFTDVET